jgi:hypothetical protein
LLTFPCIGHQENDQISPVSLDALSFGRAFISRCRSSSLSLRSSLYKQSSLSSPVPRNPSRVSNKFTPLTWYIQIVPNVQCRKRRTCAKRCTISSQNEQLVYIYIPTIPLQSRTPTLQIKSKYPTRRPRLHKNRSRSKQKTPNRLFDRPQTTPPYPSLDPSPDPSASA